VGFGDKRFKLWGSLANESPQQKLYMSFRNLCLREYLVSSYELDSKRLAQITKQIKQHRPKALVGYVSALEILANYIVKESVNDIRIPAVIPAAETLFEHQRSLFEDVFHARVFNRYGCHEFTAIAHECDRHDGMHVNAENVFLEVVKDGKPAGPDETGEIVITDLENFGFPFVRYRMEDLGRLKSGTCSCGRGLPVLAEVEGRVYDLISCPNGTVQTGTFFCKMTRSVEGILEFQIIQESKARIRFKLVTDATFNPDSVNFLISKVKLHCGEEMDVAFDFVEAIEPLKSGKRRYVVALSPGHENALNTFAGSA
jgi:phenylacetate-CoA ligase